jgi:hypothetical protein
VNLSRSSVPTYGRIRVSSAYVKLPQPWVLTTASPHLLKKTNHVAYKMALKVDHPYKRAAAGWPQGCVGSYEVPGYLEVVAL